MGCTSSSGWPLSSVYFFRIQDFTCPPRLLKVILYKPFSITVSDSLAACLVATSTFCPALPLDWGPGAATGFAVGAAAPPAFAAGAVAAGLLSGGGCGILK